MVNNWGVTSDPTMATSYQNCYPQPTTGREVLVSDSCSPFQTGPAAALKPGLCRCDTSEGTEALMLQRPGCCWTREIFVRNTSVRLCGDIPVCQPRPDCETPALRARLTDERPAGRSPGSQVSRRNISQVHTDVLVCVSSDAVELETLHKA